METKESLMLSQDKKSKWLQKLDSIIDNGFIEEDNNVYRRESVATDHFENLVDTSEDDTDVKSTTNDSSKSRTANPLGKRSVACKPFESLVDSSEDENNNAALDSSIADELPVNDPHEHHDYDVVSTSEYVVSYIAGYNLYSLIQQLENIVLTLYCILYCILVGTKTVRFDTMNRILDKVAEEKSLPFVDCQEHQLTLMKKILNYFITIRGHFLANHINKNYKQKSIKNKKLRKISKLV